MFNGQRLVIARQRRRYTSKELAERIGRVPHTVTRLEQGVTEPEPDTVATIAQVLGFPQAFFFEADAELLRDGASFRSLTSMRARDRDAALAAGSVAFLLDDWVDRRFNRPRAEVPLFDPAILPDQAARLVRHEWGLGEKPVSNMIRMLEAKGVRVFSIADTAQTVDAFSCWRGHVPYIFLNPHRSAERMRFDAAHELGHLVLHRHGGGVGRLAEQEANRFASFFLMPADDVLARVHGVNALDDLIAAKRRWGVSLAALAYRLHKLRRLSDWQYRGFCIEMQQRGYTREEPNAIAPERSVVWRKVFAELWSDRLGREHVAAELQVPVAEVENLIFGLTGGAAPADLASAAPLFLVA